MKIDIRTRKEFRDGQLNPGNLYGFIMPQLDFIFDEMNREFQDIGFSVQDVFMENRYVRRSEAREASRVEEENVWKQKHMTARRRHYERVTPKSVLIFEPSELGLCLVFFCGVFFIFFHSLFV